MKHECKIEQLEQTFAIRDVDAAANKPEDERVVLHGKTRCRVCGERGTIKIEMAARVVREMKRKADEADVGYA